MYRDQGIIYALKSTRPEFEHALKIGYSTHQLNERISNARNESTYLYADVVPVYKANVSGVSVRAVERVLHKFLEGARLDIEITHINGTVQRPAEWFDVPLDILKHGVALLKTNEIHLFRYCPKTGRIHHR